MTYLKSLNSGGGHGIKQSTTERWHGRATGDGSTQGRMKKHLKTAPRKSAACERGDHSSCFKLNCTCSCHPKQPT